MLRALPHRRRRRRGRAARGVGASGRDPRRRGARHGSSISRISRRSSAAAISRSRRRLRGCHNDPARKAAVRRRPADRDAVRHVARRQHHARPRHRHRRAGATTSSCDRFAQGESPHGKLLYPAMPYPLLHQASRRTTRWRSAPILNTVHAGAHRGRVATSCRSRSTSARRWRRGTRCSSSTASFSRIVQVGGMEPRRLSGARARPLRRLPYAEKHPRRRRAKRARCRAARCRAGSRPTSPAIRRRALAAGASTTLSTI